MTPTPQPTTNTAAARNETGNPNQVSNGSGGQPNNKVETGGNGSNVIVFDNRTNATTSNDVTSNAQGNTANTLDNTLLPMPGRKVDGYDIKQAGSAMTDIAKKNASEVSTAIYYDTGLDNTFGKDIISFQQYPTTDVVLHGAASTDAGLIQAFKEGKCDAIILQNGALIMRHPKHKSPAGGPFAMIDGKFKMPTSLNVEFSVTAKTKADKNEYGTSYNDTNVPNDLQRQAFLRYKKHLEGHYHMNNLGFLMSSDVVSDAPAAGKQDRRFIQVDGGVHGDGYGWAKDPAWKTFADQLGIDKNKARVKEPKTMNASEMNAYMDQIEFALRVCIEIKTFENTPAKKKYVGMADRGIVYRNAEKAKITQLMKEKSFTRTGGGTVEPTTQGKPDTPSNVDVGAISVEKATTAAEFSNVLKSIKANEKIVIIAGAVGCGPCDALKMGKKDLIRQKRLQDKGSNIRVVYVQEPHMGDPNTAERAWKEHPNYNKHVQAWPFVFVAQRDAAGKLSYLPGVVGSNTAGVEALLDGLVTNNGTNTVETTPTIANLKTITGEVKDANIVKAPDSISVPGKNIEIHKDVIEKFTAMKKRIKEELGLDVAIISGRRDKADQTAIRNAKRQGKRGDSKRDAAAFLKIPEAQRAAAILEYSQMPGASRHHRGTDFDMVIVKNGKSANLEPDDYTKGDGKKLADRCAAHEREYGFGTPYSKGRSGVGVEWEAWHKTFLPVSVPLYDAQVKVLQSTYPIAGFDGSTTVTNAMISPYITNIADNCKTWGGYPPLTSTKPKESTTGTPAKDQYSESDIKELESKYQDDLLPRQANDSETAKKVIDGIKVNEFIVVGIPKTTKRMDFFKGEHGVPSLFALKMNYPNARIRYMYTSDGSWKLRVGKKQANESWDGKVTAFDKKFDPKQIETTLASKGITKKK